MTKDLNEKISRLKVSLYSSEEFKEYFNLAEQIKNNKELQEILKNKKFFQQLDVQNHEQDEYTHSQYLFYSEQYSNHPLIQNYNSIKRDVYELINYLKQELSLWFTL